eukprot:TRINITY_DN55903_c0_g1_i1.p1 TRINITY_DN55903_c0_g1~~TRINITY_DN55903_c0_g1_i1.p1  ORF type:complete len:271 (+),score=65.82 TRINITY_DN55903_c0_g1_i1:81-815(+)
MVRTADTETMTPRFGARYSSCPPSLRRGSLRRAAQTPSGTPNAPAAPPPPTHRGGSREDQPSPQLHHFGPHGQGQYQNPWESYYPCSHCPCGQLAHVCIQYGCSAYVPSYSHHNPAPMSGLGISAPACPRMEPTQSAPNWDPDLVVSTRAPTPPQQHTQYGQTAPANGAAAQAPQAPQRHSNSNSRSRRGGARKKKGSGQHHQASHKRNQLFKQRPTLDEAQEEAKQIYQTKGVAVIVPVGGNP